MAGKKRKKIESRDITGLKYFDKLAPLPARLHDDACQRDAAGNRDLHYDELCMLHRKCRRDSHHLMSVGWVSPLAHRHILVLREKRRPRFIVRGPGRQG